VERYKVESGITSFTLKGILSKSRYPCITRKKEIKVNYYENYRSDAISRLFAFYSQRETRRNVDFTSQQQSRCNERI